MAAPYDVSDPGSGGNALGAVRVFSRVLVLLLTLALLGVPLGSIVLAGTRSSRRLPEAVRRELAAIPTRRWNSHLVDLEFSTGRVIEGVFVAYGKYVALIGGRMRSERYAASDVIHARDHPADT